MRNFPAHRPLMVATPRPPPRARPPGPLLALSPFEGPPALEALMRRTIATTATVVALLAVALAGGARAASPGQIIRDCTRSDTGYLKGSYTVRDLRRALKEVRGDIAEYTGCYDAIKAAIASARRPTTGGGDGGGDRGDDGAFSPGAAPGGAAGAGGGGFDIEDQVVVAGGAPDVELPATPQRGSDAPVELGGATIRPGAIPAIGQGGNALPDGVTVLLGLLGAGALAAIATTIGRRVIARRGP